MLPSKPDIALIAARADVMDLLGSVLTTSRGVNRLDGHELNEQCIAFDPLLHSSVGRGIGRCSWERVTYATLFQPVR